MSTNDLVSEAVSLRFGATVPSVFDLASYVEALRDARRRLDRVEEIMVLLTRARGEASRRATAAGYHESDAWDREARSNTVRASWNDAAPRERYASYAASHFEQTREKRRAEELLSELTVAVDVVRTCHRGLDGLRSDLQSVLRAASLATGLER